MFDDNHAPREAVDDVVVVHHLIRTLGRRPTPMEVEAYQQRQSRSAGPANSPSIPGQRLPDRDHR